MKTQEAVSARRHYEFAIETHQRVRVRQREGAKIKRWKTTKEKGDPKSEVAHCCIAGCRVVLW